MTLDNLFESLKKAKEVNVIIKADVQGSAEALAASLKKIDVEGVRVNIVHSAVGAINESDVTLAAASHHHRIQRSPYTASQTASGSRRSRYSFASHYLQSDRRNRNSDERDA